MRTQETTSQTNSQENKPDLDQRSSGMSAAHSAEPIQARCGGQDLEASAERRAKGKE